MKFKLITTIGIAMPNSKPKKPLFIEGKTTNSTITEGNILATIPLNAVRLFHKGSSNSNIHNPPQIIR
jgi:hypothetical protein